MVGAARRSDGGHICAGTEEILYRGFAYRRLAQTRLGIVGAIVFTSLAWSLIHLDPMHLDNRPAIIFPFIFLLGLLFGWLDNAVARRCLPSWCTPSSISLALCFLPLWPWRWLSPVELCTLAAHPAAGDGWVVAAVCPSNGGCASSAGMLGDRYACGRRSAFDMAL